MSDENSVEGNPKGFDLSKFEAEMNNEENPALNEQMRKEFEKLSEGSANIGSELRNPHTTSAVQEAIGRINSFQDSIKASSISDLDNKILEAMSGATGAASRAAADLQDRMRRLDIDGNTSFSRIAESLAEQQSTLDQIRLDRLETRPNFHDIRMPESPLVETNKRLERIEHRFDKISHVAETSAQTATELQLAAAEFLKDFKEAASKNDEAAAKAISLGKKAIWAAVLIPIVVFVAQIAANLIMPNFEEEAFQQTTTRLEAMFDAQQAGDAAQTQRIVDAIATADEAIAAAIKEGLEELRPPIDDVMVVE